ncbi:MAG: HAMP domain-containing histidine kinase [Chloroflexi bacterium]|nr:HAMP domain-containing histidine kinase [Chloroflexota bacterium]
MLKSVRWRLVASYMLVTVLAVSLVGILALSLLRTYVERQELVSMRANAEAVALQAEPLLWPMVHIGALRDLAETAAFLGGDQIRILGSDNRLLADSTPGADADAYVWLLPPLGLSLDENDSGSIVVSLPTFMPFMEGSVWGQMSFGELLPPDTALTLVRRIEGPWGDRIVFETGGTTVSIATPNVTANSADGNNEIWRVRVEQIQRLVRTSNVTENSTQTERRITAPVGNPLQPLGYVEVVRQSGSVAQALATTRWALMLAGLGAVALSLIVGLVVSRGLSAPLYQLALTAEQMSDGDLSARAPVRGGEEIERVARQFNEMAERLEISFATLASERDALRRFIADASHELRTPITALRNYNELLQGPAIDDLQARSEFLSESQTQLDRLEWITQHLLDLSRINAGLVNLDLMDCDVDDLLTSAVATFRPRAQEKGIQLTMAVPSDPVNVRCDRTRIALALSNLLDNAIKFTPEEGHVELGATSVGDQLEIWVQDDGPGIDAGDRDQIFERFYRGAGDGHGLGLAIVQSNVQAQGGQVFLDESWPSGSRFVITMPLI